MNPYLSSNMNVIPCSLEAFGCSYLNNGRIFRNLKAAENLHEWKWIFKRKLATFTKIQIQPLNSKAYPTVNRLFKQFLIELHGKHT